METDFTEAKDTFRGQEVEFEIYMKSKSYMGLFLLYTAIQVEPPAMLEMHCVYLNVTVFFAIKATIFQTK